MSNWIPLLPAEAVYLEMEDELHTTPPIKFLKKKKSSWVNARQFLENTYPGLVQQVGWIKYLDTVSLFDKKVPLLIQMLYLNVFFWARLAQSKRVVQALVGRKSKTWPQYRLQAVPAVSINHVPALNFSSKEKKFQFLFKKKDNITDNNVSITSQNMTLYGSVTMHSWEKSHKNSPCVSDTMPKWP